MKRLGFLLTLLGVLLPLAASAQDFIRTAVPGKNICVYWDQREYIYRLDSAGYSQDPTDNVPNAVDASFSTWQTLSDWCSGFEFKNGGRIENPQLGYVQGGTNTNDLTFRENLCDTAVPDGDSCTDNESCPNKYKCWEHGDDTIALTTLTFNTTTGITLDADIEFNAAPHTDGSQYLFTTVNSPPCSADNINTNCVAQDVQDTLTHEIGHVIGLAHVPSETSTMNASAELGETRKRIIDSGTAAGLCDIYPRGGASTADCQIESSVEEAIVAKNTGSSFFGTSGCTAVTGAASGSSVFIVAGLWLALKGTKKTRRKRGA